MHKTGWMIAMTALAVAAPAAAEPGWSVPRLPGDAGKPFLVPPKTTYLDPSLAPAIGPASSTVPADMKAVAQIGWKWGTVTSVLRSVTHNKAVGGVANSYHLSGRAIDIARRPGVRHADIAAALRKAGFRPVESLDEGDHSHFAFARAGEVARAAAVIKPLFQLAAFDVNGSDRSRSAPPAPHGAGN